MKSEIIHYLIGDQPISILIAGFIAAIFGIIGALFMAAMQRDPNKIDSPTKFDWAHLWCDNNRRMLINFVGNVFLTVILVRFAGEYLGDKLTIFSAFGIGLGYDKARTTIMSLFAKK